MAYNGVDNAKSHKFNIEITGYQGINKLLIQEFTPPSVEVGFDMHGGFVGEPDIKTPNGKKKVGEIKFKMLMPLDIDSTLESKILLALNAPASVSFEIIAFTMTDSSGLIPLNQWFGTNCFFTKITPPAFSREGDSKNVMFDVEMQCTNWVKRF